MTPSLMFDLGGVIIDIDRNRAVESFRRLGMKTARDFFDPYRQQGHFLLLEEGAVTPAQFRNNIRPLFSRPVTDNEIDRGLFDFLIGIPEQRLSRLADLRRQGHRVYLLSNTNAIMWTGAILPEFTKLGGDINDYFDGIITSFQARCCKPDARIFHLACSRFGIEPAETTFFDDSAANVNAARALGFRAELVDPQNDFMSLTSRK